MTDMLEKLILYYPLTTLLLFGIVSLMIGSVLSMIIYRLPIMLTHASDARFNFFLPRSHCRHCKKTIAAYYNIPILGYLLLRGCCNHCGVRIAWQYPLIEGLTLILSLLALYCFGYHVTLLLALVFIWITICLAFIDCEHQLLPDVLTLSLLWIGLCVNTQAVFCTTSAAIWGASLAYTSLWLLIKVFYLITGKIGMGHGDFKLFAAFGAWFGWLALSNILLVACILGSVIGIAYLRLTSQARHTPIPFGPYLCTAGCLYLLFFCPMLK